MQFIKEAIKAVIFYNKLQMRHIASISPLRTFLTRATETPRRGLSVSFNCARAHDTQPGVEPSSTWDLDLLAV